MRVTILGCGGSGGVPVIGGVDGKGAWGACDPADERNRRTRSSILVQDQGTNLLVDTAPDLRHQLLVAGVADITAVLYTHTHADHIHGIDELRAVKAHRGAAVDVYGQRATMNALRARFGYVFDGSGIYAPTLTPHVVDGPLAIAGLRIEPFEQGHGTETTTGYRIGDMAYSTDVESLDEAAFGVLAGVKLWIVDCLQTAPHPTHAHFTKTVEWIGRVAPERAILTHLGMNMDYATVRAMCPDGIEPAFDQLVIEL
ncbi:MAG: MBL fold metallo-hydrolase [Alphaproteobacteria bacterium]|nr:MBL fold metallo-hydrolase [Alphaproteobacteria bacterium]